MSPKKEFIPYLFLFFGVFCLFSLLSFSPQDEMGSGNWFGRLGHYFAYGVFFLLGKAGYLIGLGLVGMGIYIFKKPDLDILGKILQLPLLILSVSLALGFLTEGKGEIGAGGGILGEFLGMGLDFAIGGTGKAILTSFLFAYSVFAIINDESLACTKKRIMEILQILQEKGASLFPGLPKVAYSHSGVVAPNQTGKQEQKFPENTGFPGGESSKLPWQKGWEDLLHSINPSEIREFLLKKKKDLEEKRIQKLKSSVMEPVPEPLSWKNEESHESEEEYSFTKPKGEKPRSKHSMKTFSKTASQKKIFPRYKNVSLYEGFFEEEKVFKFHNTPVSLKRKLSETPDSHSLGFRILDYRRDRRESYEDSVDGFEGDGSEFETEEFTLSDTDVFTENEFREGIENEGLVENELREVGGFLPDHQTPEKEGEEIEEKPYFSEFSNHPSDSTLESSEWIENPEKNWVSTQETNPEQEENEKEEWDQEPRIHHFSSPPVATQPREELPKTFVPQVPLKKGGYYISPRLLGPIKEKPMSQESKADTDRVARKIEEIISHYGIESKVITLERGPIITRYELTIPNGIKLNKITSLDSELKLYLAVKSIRIVAPIPGKSSIGIEVPNRHREDVYLTDILRETTFAKSFGGLNICIGKDIAGRPMNIDLTKLPHLLVAGTTGSGKSVSLNSMVTSLIYSRSPEELRFIMIDPKMVEMTLYEEIPHLLMPVIVDPRRATKALSWAIQEMEARYQNISTLKCRDFSSYNMKVEEWAHKKGYEKMPYIVIVIDELSDLMMVSGKELEEQIQRISQKSRAVGIHLVMATQRPSVDVITGLIKANCPARMAFQVAQKTDSRTILDSNGAEALLGKGDFLYRSPTASDLVRIQAPFVAEEEIEKIVEESKKMASPGYVEINWEEESSESSDGFEEDEALIEGAWRVICAEGKASGSLIQRHLRIGYNKAARIIDILEKRGIVSPQIGTKPREILKPI